MRHVYTLQMSPYLVLSYLVDSIVVRNAALNIRALLCIDGPSIALNVVLADVSFLRSSALTYTVLSSAFWLPFPYRRGA